MRKIYKAGYDFHKRTRRRNDKRKRKGGRNDNDDDDDMHRNAVENALTVSRQRGGMFLVMGGDAFIGSGGRRVVTKRRRRDSERERGKEDAGTPRAITDAEVQTSREFERRSVAVRASTKMYRGFSRARDLKVQTNPFPCTTFLTMVYLLAFRILLRVFVAR